MAGFGYGFGFRANRRQFLKAAGLAALGVVLPNPLWNGTAASGFAAAPVDPARTTAKPAMRLLVPPNQYFSDTLLVGVYAGANDHGSLLDNMGLEKVVAHYEGMTFDILSPSLATIIDANGNPASYFGWWVNLKNDGRHGAANVYFEAIPKDPTMQHRVIGPYTFHPAATTTPDFDIEVAASATPVAGATYNTVKAALTYLKGVSAKNPRIRITQPGLYTLDSVVGGYTGIDGWCEITATVPGVSFGRASFTGDSASWSRPNVNGLRFKGANIAFDWANSIGYFVEVGQRMWLDGVTLMNSAGRQQLVRKGLPNVYALFGNPFWMTECNVSNSFRVVAGAELVRGCSFTDCWGDLFSSTRCAVANRIDGLDANIVQTDRPALSVRYTGSGSTATIELSGAADGTSRTITAKVDGTSAGAFTVLSSEAAWTANTNYTVKNVVDWLNTLPGWSANLLDDTRRATMLSLPLGFSNAFGPTDAKTSALTLVTMSPDHIDWYVINVGGLGENVVVADNVSKNLLCQDIFLAVSSPPLSDFLFVNNAFFNRIDDPTGGYYPSYTLSSQLGRNVHSHVVVAHNTLATQDIMLRSDTGYKPDAYCLVANNAVHKLYWVGTPDTNLAITNNHLQTGATAPAYATGTTIGGDYTTLFVDAVNGNFAPTGALLTGVKTPSLATDLTGKRRAALDAAGALL